MAEFMPPAPEVRQDIKQEYYWKQWFQQLWKSYTRNQLVADVQTVAFTANLDNYYYPCAAGGGGFAVTLPPAVNNEGKKIAIYKLSGAGALTIALSGADTISPAAPAALAIGQTNIYISDGLSIWYKVSIS